MTNKTDSSTIHEPMKLRITNLKKLSEETFDVLIIGGGINGAVSAAALSQKGVRTALIDQGDFAGMTSQESSNLAWGGIKYLENLVQIMMLLFFFTIAFGIFFFIMNLCGEQFKK